MRGEGLRVMVMREASRGASCGSPPWKCLMPAWVREEAFAVVGVVVPEDSGVRAAGAIVSSVLVV